MQILPKLTLFLLASTTMLPVHAGVFDISEQEINHFLANKLSEKVALQDSVGVPNLFELDYKLHSLTSKIGQTDEKKVALSGAVDGILKVRGKKYDASIFLNMDTTPYYDPEKGALFLKDIRLLNWSAEPSKYQNELQMFLPMLADGLNSFLNTTPVYTLDDSNTKESMVKKFGKAIVVEKGKIKLETALF